MISHIKREEEPTPKLSCISHVRETVLHNLKHIIFIINITTFNRRHSSLSHYLTLREQQYHQVWPIWFNYIKTFTCLGSRKPSSEGAQGEVLYSYKGQLFTSSAPVELIAFTIILKMKVILHKIVKACGCYCVKSVLKDFLKLFYIFIYSVFRFSVSRATCCHYQSLLNFDSDNTLHERRKTWIQNSRTCNRMLRYNIIFIYICLRSCVWSLHMLILWILIEYPWSLYIVCHDRLWLVWCVMLDWVIGCRLYHTIQATTDHYTRCIRTKDILSVAGGLILEDSTHSF
jgi:hypothetical protein